VQAFEDRASRILLEDQRDELQAAAARAGQSIDVVDALQELGPVNTGRWFTNGGYGNVLGGDGGRAIRSRLAALVSRACLRVSNGIRRTFRTT